MFQTQVAQKIKIHVLCSTFVLINHAVYEIMWKNTYSRSRQATAGNIIRRMLFACWITKAIDTHM
jgi:hypothetical protein